LIVVDDEELLDRLMDRFKEYTHITDTSDVVYNLYKEMYERELEDGLFDKKEFNASTIVDNDWDNWCEILEEGDDEFEEIKQAYLDGDSDISHLGYSSIEAVDNESNPTVILVRK